MRFIHLFWRLLFGLGVTVAVIPLALAASLQPQDISGVVQVAPTAQAAWEPLTANLEVQAGQTVQTGPQSAVSLLADDGTVLLPGANTHLSIDTLDFSTTSQRRIYRVTLLRGTLTVNIKPVAFPSADSIVEIYTTMLTIKANAQPDVPDSEVQVMYDPARSISAVTSVRGTVKILQRAEGTAHVTGLVRCDGKENLRLVVPLELVGTEILMAWQASPEALQLLTNLTPHDLANHPHLAASVQVPFLSDQDVILSNGVTPQGQIWMQMDCAEIAAFEERKPNPPTFPSVDAFPQRMPQPRPFEPSGSPILP